MLLAGGFTRNSLSLPIHISLGASPMRQTSIIFLVIFLSIFFESFLIFDYFNSALLVNFFGLMSVISYALTLLPGIARAIFPRLKRHGCLTWLLKYRRYTGVAAFCFGAEHGILILIQQQADMLDFHTYLQYSQGFIMLGIFTLLTATSNDESVKWLKRNWKELHQLTYLIPMLLVWHLLTKMTVRTWITPIALWTSIFIMIFLMLKIWLGRKPLKQG
ncbi:MAG: iron reductase [Cyanothece sp. SIO1E1]|nr:iron reductase [Cyanothece sp. SIO1E1]